MLNGYDSLFTPLNVFEGKKQFCLTCLTLNNFDSKHLSYSKETFISFFIKSLNAAFRYVQNC